MLHHTCVGSSFGSVGGVAAGPCRVTFYLQSEFVKTNIMRSYCNVWINIFRPGEKIPAFRGDIGNTWRLLSAKADMTRSGQRMSMLRHHTLGAEKKVFLAPSGGNDATGYDPRRKSIAKLDHTQSSNDVPPLCVAMSQTGEDSRGSKAWECGGSIKLVNTASDHRPRGSGRLLSSAWGAQLRGPRKRLYMTWLKAPPGYEDLWESEDR